MTISKEVIALYDKPPFPTVVGNHVQIHNPFDDPAKKDAIYAFCEKFYNDDKPRLHLLGINPSRLTDTSSGVNYTDGFALDNLCGIDNEFSKTRELTSKFFYMVVEKMGGAALFYANIFAWALMPLSVTKDNSYKNYYENDVIEQLRAIVLANVNWLNKNVPATGVAVILGTGENKNSFQKLVGYPFGYKKITYLPHPRWVMQYNSAKLDYYINMYVDALS